MEPAFTRWTPWGILPLPCRGERRGLRNGFQTALSGRTPVAGEPPCRRQTTSTSSDTIAAPSGAQSAGRGCAGSGRLEADRSGPGLR